MTLDMFFFSVQATIVIASALGMLFSQNAVYSALFLIVNFGTIAVFYLLLGAPFIAMAQITVYAGAIMVLFLFVIMLLGADSLAPGKALPWQKPLAAFLAFVLVVETIYLLAFRGVPPGSVTNPDATVNTVDWMVGLGGALFNQYLLPFEITSILLLVAMVGAIVLTKQEKGGRK